MIFNFYCFIIIFSLSNSLFKNTFNGLPGKHLSQSYCKLYNLNKDKDFVCENSPENINDLIIDDEITEEVITKSILEMVEKYRDYKKISKYRPDIKRDKIK